MVDLFNAADDDDDGGDIFKQMSSRSAAENPSNTAAYTSGTAVGGATKHKV